VNNQTVIAYWLIGREIFQELQAGEKRAAHDPSETSKIKIAEYYDLGAACRNKNIQACLAHVVTTVLHCQYIVLSCSEKLFLQNPLSLYFKYKLFIFNRF